MDYLGKPNFNDECPHKRYPEEKARQSQSQR